jgi:hypothetical protein
MNWVILFSWTDIANQIKRFYPDWTMRIYHDQTIKPSLKCELECLEEADNSLLDNVDFCDIDRIGYWNKTLSVRDMHKMIWRFLPIGESFVDAIMSRDADSNIIQREVDSVKVWFSSPKVGHIMRGNLLSVFNPYYSVPSKIRF